MFWISARRCSSILLRIGSALSHLYSGADRLSGALSACFRLCRDHPDQSGNDGNLQPFLQKALQTHWEINNAMYQYQALERYQWFLRNYPNLDEQVNSRYIASFLSITPVTLSRLRRWLKGQADHHE